MLFHWKSFPLFGFRRSSLRTLPTTRPWKEQRTVRFAHRNFLLFLKIFANMSGWFSFWRFRSLWPGREISSEAVLRRQMRWAFNFQRFFSGNLSGEHLWWCVQSDHLWASLLKEVQVWIQARSLPLWHPGNWALLILLVLVCLQHWFSQPASTSCF